MKYTMLLITCGVAILAVACSTLQKSNSAALQGTWTGQEIGGRTPGECRLTVTGKDLEFRGANPNEWYKGTYIVREDTKPKQVIATITECPFPKYVGKTVNGIFQLERGTLTLTGNEPGNPEMPADFDAPNGRKFVLKKL